MIAKPNLPIYARGGDTVTSVSRFIKQPDAFRHDTEKTEFKKVGKGGSLSKLTGDKSGKSGRLPKKGHSK